jgi:hypothetical protein
MKNGDLLRAAQSAGFEVFVTADQGIPYQQNLEAIGMATVILVARTNRLADLEPLMPRVVEALTSIRPGDVLRVASPFSEPDAAVRSSGSPR